MSYRNTKNCYNIPSTHDTVGKSTLSELTVLRADPKPPIVIAEQPKRMDELTLRNIICKIDKKAVELGVELDRTLDNSGLKIADINDPIHDGKLRKLELFAMLLHARQEVILNYLISEEETHQDDEKN